MTSELRSGELRSDELRSRFRYDFATAVTFLIFGLGAGWLLAMLRSPGLHQAAAQRFAARPRAS